MLAAVSTFSWGISLWKLAYRKPLIAHFSHLSSLPFRTLADGSGCSRSARVGTAPWQYCSQSAVCCNNPNACFSSTAARACAHGGHGQPPAAGEGAFLRLLEESWEPLSGPEGVWDDGGRVASDVRAWWPPGGFSQTRVQETEKNTQHVTSMNKTYNSETPELNEKIYKTDKDLSNHGFGKRKKSLVTVSGY